jgi:hypothetical protein
MAELDRDEASNYRCTLSKNGVQQYFFGKARVAKALIPKAVLASIICPQKGVALVSERKQAFEAVAPTSIGGLEKKAARLKKGLAKIEEKKAAKKAAKTSPPRSVSPARNSPPKKGVQYLPGDTRPGSPIGKGGRAKPSLPACPKASRPTDYDFLRFFWEEARPAVPARRLGELVARFEAEYGSDYPFDDRNAVLAETARRRSSPPRPPPRSPLRSPARR